MAALYTIVLATDNADLANKITGMLDLGWKPCGGGSVCSYQTQTDVNGIQHHYPEFAQAMTKGLSA